MIKARTRRAAIGLGAIIAYLAISTMIYLIIKDSVITAILTNVLTALVVIIWRIRAQTHADSLVIPTHHTWKELTFLPVTVIAVNITSTMIALWVKAQVPNSALNKDILANTPVILVIALSLILAPVGEEALIRGFIYPILRRSFSALTTIIVTTAVFALLHGNLAQIVLTVPLGIILGYVYERTHRLNLCIGSHALFNLTAILTPTQRIISETQVLFAGVLTIEIVLIWVFFTEIMNLSTNQN